MDVVVGSAIRVITAWMFAGAGWTRSVPLIPPFLVLATADRICDIVAEVMDAITVALVRFV